MPTFFGLYIFFRFFFFFEQSAAYNLPPDLPLREVRQSTALPGQLNNITISLRPSTTLLPNSRLVIEDLLDSAVLFARTTEKTCSAATGLLSDADGDREHTAWTQELYANGKLQFKIIWLFTKTRTLDDRLDVMSSANGEGVRWCADVHKHL